MDELFEGFRNCIGFPKGILRVGSDTQDQIMELCEQMLSMANNEKLDTNKGFVLCSVYV